jgi:lysine biosynthesis protein LysW
MTVSYCPECGGSLNLGPRPQESQQVTCAECGARIEIISLKPLELDWVYAEPTDQWADICERDLEKTAEWEEL